MLVRGEAKPGSRSDWRRPAGSKPTASTSLTADAAESVLAVPFRQGGQAEDQAHDESCAQGQQEIAKNLVGPAQGHTEKGEGQARTQSHEKRVPGPHRCNRVGCCWPPRPRSTALKPFTTARRLLVVVAILNAAAGIDTRGCRPGEDRPVAGAWRLPFERRLPSGTCAPVLPRLAFPDQPGSCLVGASQPMMATGASQALRSTVMV